MKRKSKNNPKPYERKAPRVPKDTTANTGNFGMFDLVSAYLIKWKFAELLPLKSKAKRKATS